MPTAERTAKNKLRTIQLEAPTTVPVMEVVREAPENSPSSAQGVRLVKEVPLKKVRINVPQAKALAAELHPQIEARLVERRLAQRSSLEWLNYRAQLHLTNPLMTLLRETAQLAHRMKQQFSTLDGQLRENQVFRSQYQSHWHNEPSITWFDFKCDGVSEVENRIYEAEFVKFFGPDPALPTLEQIQNRILVTTIPLSSMNELAAFSQQVIVDLVPALNSDALKTEARQLAVTA